ncbi:hypothetical protein MJD09_20510, partial [bacterium]|nr:hypothetical protein [bacterium]
VTGTQITQHPSPKRTPIVVPVQLSGGHLSSANDGTFLFSNIINYHVLRLNCKGDTLVTYRANPKGYQPPDLSNRERFMKQREWAIVGVPLQLEDGILVQWFKRKSASEGRNVKWERYADLFTNEGRPLALGIPSPHIFLYSRDDLLYAVDMSPLQSDESHNPVIVIYRLANFLD